MKEDFIAVIELKSVGLGHLSDGGKINVHKDETNRVLEFEGDIYEVFSAPGYDKKNHCIVALAVKHGEDVFFSFETKKEYAVLYALFIDIKKSLKHCTDVSGIPFSDAIVCSNALITKEDIPRIFNGKHKELNNASLEFFDLNDLYAEAKRFYVL